jgi:hypothetical protein
MITIGMITNIINSKGSDKSKGCVSSGFGVPMGTCNSNKYKRVNIGFVYWILSNLKKEKLVA